MANTNKERNGDCPNCNSIVELNESEKLINYGKPLKKCPRCGNIFIDKRLKELAVYGIEKNDRKFIKKESWNLLFIGAGLTALFILILHLLSNSGGGQFRGNVIGILLILLGPIILLCGIYSVIYDMVTYKKRLIFLEKELVESKKRLQDPDYAEIIRKYRYN